MHARELASTFNQHLPQESYSWWKNDEYVQNISNLKSKKRPDKNAYAYSNCIFVLFQENQQTLDVRQKDSCSACQTCLTWPLESYKSNKARHSQEQIHCLVQVLGKEILSSSKIKMAESWDTAVWRLLLIRGMFHCLMKLVITQRALSIFNQTKWKFFITMVSQC